jgi:site-specific recombinase XerD
MSAAIVLHIPRGLAALSTAVPALFVPNAAAAERFFEFFTVNIRNKNTRRAYYKAVCRFADWCEGRGVGNLADVRPMHVAAYIEALGGAVAKPTVKQHLAAIRMLFDWLVVGQVLGMNPGHAVRGPKHVVKKGRTPVLDRDEARALLAAIDTGSLTDLRDRALPSIINKIALALAEFAPGLRIDLLRKPDCRSDLQTCWNSLRI